MMNRMWILVVAILVGPWTMAAPRMAGIFSNGMVLQRDKDLPVWGWAEPGEAITVTLGQETVAATAGADGTWRVVLKPRPATAEPLALVVKGAEDAGVTIENVVVGDVWICSGQSNMEWSVNGVTNSAEVRGGAEFPLIRHVKVPRAAVDKALEDVTVQWQLCSPATVGNFTAVGYFFARHLHQELGVPIGLIGTNWGGTRIEPWCTPEGIAAIPELADVHARLQNTNPATDVGKSAFLKALDAHEAWLAAARQAVAVGEYPASLPAMPVPEQKHGEPTRLYNGMIAPLVPFVIRGAIWYQGESNGGEHLSYYHKMHALVNGWRQLWQQGEFPFYYVQLANYQAPLREPAGGNGWAKLREAQVKALDIVNSGMAVIIDIGEAHDIHPRNKQDVGYRLALWALANEYGQSDLVCSGPLYRSQAVEGGAIRLTFDHVGSGLMVGRKEGLAPTVEDTAGKLDWFAIAGADQKWHWAEAVIDGETVMVSSPEVTEPVAVRYAFSMNPEGCNLYNREGLPASPFRTDSW